MNEIKKCMHEYILFKLSTQPLYFCLYYFSLLKPWFESCQKFCTLNGFSCEPKSRMGLKWLEGCRQSVCIWVRTQSYWNVWRIETLEICIWVNFYISVLIKWLQIFMFQSSFINLADCIFCLMTLGVSRSWAHQCSLCGIWCWYECFRGFWV